MTEEPNSDSDPDAYQDLWRILVRRWTTEEPDSWRSSRRAAELIVREAALKARISEVLADSTEAVDRLDEELSPRQKEDVVIVAARIQADATLEAATIGRTATTRAALIAFVGTLLGAAIGAGASNWLYDLLNAAP